MTIYPSIATSPTLSGPARLFLGLPRTLHQVPSNPGDCEDEAVNRCFERVEAAPEGTVGGRIVRNGWCRTIIDQNRGKLCKTGGFTQLSAKSPAAVGQDYLAGLVHTEIRGLETAGRRCVLSLQGGAAKESGKREQRGRQHLQRVFRG